MSLHNRRPQHYRAAVDAFDWSEVLADLGWSGQATVDLAWTIVDRHARGPDGDRSAVLWLGRDGSERRISFRELSAASARFGNLFRRLGVRKGDRIAGILPRIPETVPAILGALRVGAVYVPVFTGFGAEAAAYRIAHSGARMVCTDARFRHLASSADQLPVVVIGGGATQDIDCARALAQESDDCPAERYARNEPAAIIYTSGSTGCPKGCVIAANLPAVMWPYARYGLDLRPDDVFWPTGDPGWGYGLCCYLPALTMGCAVISVEANANAQVCLDVLARYRVTNLATTPTVLRGLMALGDSVRAAGASLRAISSCGEPLNAEVVEFFSRVWGAIPMDHFGATEFGLPIGNHNALGMVVKPGSMGLPAPGQTMAIVDEHGHELPPETVGLIAQRSNHGSRYWLRYWKDAAASAGLRRGAWTCTGDLARRDADGYFWFEGRADDIIKSSGYRIGPFEIESALLRHPAVAEAAVVGVPDPLRGQAIKACVVTRLGVKPPRADELIALVEATCGRHQRPHVVELVDALPKTETGKIQRFLLRQGARSREDRS
jgi:acetyl-CoA synthetase